MKKDLKKIEVVGTLLLKTIGNIKTIYLLVF